MQSIRRPKLRVLALFSLVFLTQCCCCILPVTWGMERWSIERAIQALPPEMRGSNYPVESAIRFAK